MGIRKEGAEYERPPSSKRVNLEQSEVARNTPAYRQTSPKQRSRVSPSEDPGRIS